jgi:hypothetical protein
MSSFPLFECFHTVHDDRRASVAERAGVEEARYGADQVVIEHGQAVEHRLIDRDGVGVGRGAGADLSRLIADRDLLLERRERERDSQRRRRTSTNRHPRCALLEARERDVHLVASRRDSVEPEIARGIGRRLLNGAASRCREHDLRIREDGAGGIDRHADDRLRRRGALGMCSKREREEYEERYRQIRDRLHDVRERHSTTR